MNEDLQMLKKLLLKSNLLDDDKKHYCADFVRELLCEEKTDKYPEPLCKILDYIDKNSHRTITNTELCSISFLSEPSVISLMKKYFHKTPNHYITYLRISKSQKMLIETDETIKNIAYSVGFSDNLYFCRVFKKETGVSPTEFRKMYSI